MQCPETSHTNPIKAIRKKCVDCSAGSVREVKNCEKENCALHPFRFGKNPFRTKRELTEEERGALRERMKKAQEARKAKKAAAQ